MIDVKYKNGMDLPEPAFGNVEYRLQLTMTVSTDKRIMSFIDPLWGFEVTGGYDQYEPLTIIAVSVLLMISNFKKTFLFVPKKLHSMFYYFYPFKFCYNKIIHSRFYEKQNLIENSQLTERH